MKKHLLFLYLLFSVESFALTQIQPGLSLSQGSNSYLITFTNDNINVRDSILASVNGEYKFSYVQLTPDYYE